ncbi:uncharacterized protein [Drosophila pseudoobscura]|uniref:Uncharacterized protein isoform X1 n=1 Tax=Drosophila pseudoobscura pseudoobscura TaxID=46245 RepID=A0A6I8VZ59_DROPS|nr:uncharacterized protein LOC117184013 isoform X1 [Drosophila pseudoobscura]
MMPSGSIQTLAYQGQPRSRRGAGDQRRLRGYGYRCRCRCCCCCRCRSIEVKSSEVIAGASREAALPGWNGLDAENGTRVTLRRHSDTGCPAPGGDIERSQDSSDGLDGCLFHKIRLRQDHPVPRINFQ